MIVCIEKQRIQLIYGHFCSFVAGVALIVGMAPGPDFFLNCADVCSWLMSAQAWRGLAGSVTEDCGCDRINAALGETV